MHSARLQINQTSACCSCFKQIPKCVLMLVLPGQSVWAFRKARWSGLSSIVEGSPYDRPLWGASDFHLGNACWHSTAGKYLLYFLWSMLPFQENTSNLILCNGNEPGLVCLICPSLIPPWLSRWIRRRPGFSVPYLRIKQHVISSDISLLRPLSKVALASSLDATITCGAEGSNVLPSRRAFWWCELVAWYLTPLLKHIFSLPCAYV